MSKKVLLAKDFLDEFTSSFKEYCSYLELTLKYKKEVDIDVLEGILELQKQWEEFYSPNVRDLKNIARNLYSKYIMCRKEGKKEEAQQFYEMYAKIKKTIDELESL